MPFGRGLEMVTETKKIGPGALLPELKDARPRLADAIDRPFFLAGMAVIVTVGAAWGALL